MENQCNIEKSTLSNRDGGNQFVSQNITYNYAQKNDQVDKKNGSSLAIDQDDAYDNFVEIEKMLFDENCNHEDITRRCCIEFTNKRYSNIWKLLELSLIGRNKIISKLLMEMLNTQEETYNGIDTLITFATHHKDDELTRFLLSKNEEKTIKIFLNINSIDSIKHLIKNMFPPSKYEKYFSDYADDHIGINNFLYFLDMAQTINLKSVNDSIEKFIRNNSLQIFDDKHFINMNPNTIKYMIESPKLSVENKFYLINKWIAFDEIDRVDHLDELKQIMVVMTNQINQSSVSNVGNQIINGQVITSTLNKLWSGPTDNKNFENKTDLGNDKNFAELEKLISERDIDYQEIHWRMCLESKEKKYSNIWKLLELSLIHEKPTISRLSMNLLNKKDEKNNCIDVLIVFAANRKDDELTRFLLSKNEEKTIKIFLDMNSIDSIEHIIENMFPPSKYEKYFSDYADDHIGINNFLYFLDMAQTLNLKSVNDSIEKFIRNNSLQIFDNKYFIYMNPNTIKYMIESPNLSQEYKIHLLDKWIAYDKNNRVDHMEELIKIIGELKNEFKERLIITLCLKYDVSHHEIFDITREKLEFIRNMAENISEYLSRYSKDFVKLSYAELVLLLKYGKTLTHEMVLLSITTWILFDCKNRRAYMNLFTNFIKFDSLSDDVLQLIFNKLQVLIEHSTLLILPKELETPKKHKIKVYNGKKKEWVPFFDIKTDIVYHSAVYYKDNIMLIGGYDGKKNVSNFVSFDIKSKSITYLAHLKRARNGSTVSVIEDKIFVCGGENGDYLNSVEMWDPDIRKWKDVSPMHHGRSMHTATVYQNKLFVFGGLNKFGTMASVEIYNPQQDEWSEATPMPKSLKNCGSAVINDKIFVMGGNFCDKTGCIYSTKNVIIYDPTQNSWSIGRDLPNPTNHCSAVTMEGKIIVSGSNFVIQYDPIEDSWKKHSTPLTTLEFHDLFKIPEGIINF